MSVEIIVRKHFQTQKDNFDLDVERYNHLSTYLPKAFKNIEPLIVALNSAMNASQGYHAFRTEIREDYYALEFQEHKGGMGDDGWKTILKYTPDRKAGLARTRQVDYYLDAKDLDKINSCKVKTQAMTTIFANKICAIATRYIHPSRLHHLGQFLTEEKKAGVKPKTSAGPS